MEKKHFWKGFGCGAGTVILVNLAIIAGLFLTAMILLGRTDTESCAPMPVGCLISGKRRMFRHRSAEISKL